MQTTQTVWSLWLESPSSEEYLQEKGVKSEESEEAIYRGNLQFSLQYLGLSAAGHFISNSTNKCELLQS